MVWQSADQDGNGYGVFGQRFGPSGAAVGGEFLVNSATAGFFGTQHSPSVDSDTSGNFVVAWSNQYTFFGPTMNRISGQRFDSAGAPQGSEFFVDQSTAGNEGGPRVARTEAGNFLVTWSRSSGFPIPSGDVIGRFFDATAAPLGPEFHVHTHTLGSQGGASVDADRNGHFVVVWESRGQEGPTFETGVFLRRFDAAGVPVEDEVHRQLVHHRQPAPPHCRVEPGRELRRRLAKRPGRGRERLRAALRRPDLQGQLRVLSPRALRSGPSCDQPLRGLTTVA